LPEATLAGTVAVTLVSLQLTTLACVPLIVTRGKSLAEFSREQIFDPLGMMDTSIVDRYPDGIAALARGYRPDAGGFAIDETGWEQVGYDAFVSAMNLVAAPQVVALVVVMGLCVPKRLFSRRALIAVSAGMVAVGIVAWLATSSLATGLAVYLVLAGLIQLAVVLLTAVGARGPSYLTEGRLTKLGSGLLHLGFIVFALVVVALQRSSFMIEVFWVSALLLTVGSAMSFYAGKLAVRRTAPPVVVA